MRSNTPRDRARTVRNSIRWASTFSSLLYLLWGIWPLLEWLTLETNRRDFCGDLHTYGTLFSIACVAAAFLIFSSLLSFMYCNPEGRCFVCSIVPLITHALAFLIAVAMTAQVSAFLWSRDPGTTSPGELCQLESELFYHGAEVYTKVSFGILTIELLLCLYLCKIFLRLCRNGSSVVEVVFDDLETNELIHSTNESSNNTSTVVSIVPGMSEMIRVTGEETKL